jgi:hypothetical protein
MWVEVATAVSAAVVMGAIALVPRTFEYWRYWTRGPFAWAVVAYAALNAASGAVGALLAALLDWNPSDSAALRGLAYAAAGQALLRVQLHAFGTERIKNAASLLGSGIARVTDWLNLVANRRVQEMLNKLSDDELSNFALYLYGRHVDPDKYLAQPQKAIYLAAIVDAAEQLGGAGTARGTLEEFCAREIEERQLAGVSAALAERGDP